MIFLGDFIPQKTKVVLPEHGEEWLVANLEGPVCEDGLDRASKIGVHLRSEPFDCDSKLAFSLANNHLMDFGVEGLAQTEKFLRARDYHFAGAGINEAEARRPMIIEESGKLIAVICCCERQFGVASENRAGVAAKGEWLYSAIAELKKTVDFVVVSCHAASEFSTAVSPKLQAFYHSLIDYGADVIHGHHSHVPQGWEVYKGRPIFYGLGNSVVDSSMWKNLSNGLWSLVARVDFGKKVPAWTIRPFGEVPQNAEDYLKRANLGFEKPELLEALWQKESVRLFHDVYEQYMRVGSVEKFPLSLKDRARKIFAACGDVVRAIIGKEIPTAYSMQHGRIVFNLFNCESHVDMISTALGVLTGSIEDVRERITV